MADGIRLRHVRTKSQSSEDERSPSPDSELEIEPSTGIKDKGTLDFSELKGRSFTFKSATNFGCRDISVFEENKLLFFADLFTWKAPPDVRLHREDPEGPVAGIIHLRWTKKAPKVGLGSDELSMDWIEMKRTRSWAKGCKQRFEWGGKTYMISRLNETERAVFGVKQGLRVHFKVVEEASAVPMAVYLSGTAFKARKAELKMKEGLSEELSTLIVLGIIAWREILRRD